MEVWTQELKPNKVGLEVMNIAEMIVTVVSLFSKILPMITLNYRRQELANHFKCIISLLNMELEDKFLDRTFIKAYINPHGLTPEEIELTISRNSVGFDQKIPAIKAYRDRHRDSWGNGIGLKEAKDIIEKFQKDNG
jgi:hypothetical protein